MTQTENAKIVDRIDAVLAGPFQGYGMDDERVLRYIRSQITPEGLKERARQEETDEDDGIEPDTDVKHLRQVAAARLKPYEQKEA